MRNNEGNNNSNNNNNEGLGDEFFEQILSGPGYNGSPLFLGLGQGNGSGQSGFSGGVMGMGLGMPLGLHLEHGNASSAYADVASSSSSRINENEMHLTNLFPAFGHLQSHPVRAPPPSVHVQQSFQGHGTSGQPQTVSHAPSMRPRMRARRGQATDPHSIAERLRRERIAERMKALQELVPSCNKTDRAAMLDEIVDYVKFLRLQVKVLSMSRLGGAGAVAQLVADVPPASFEGEGAQGLQQAWDKWSNDDIEEQVARLIEQDIGSAMQFLQSKALCMMPISLASAIFRSHPPPPDYPSIVKPETNPPP